MSKLKLRPAALVAFLATLALPALPARAQLHIDVPGIEVRIGRHGPPPLRHEHRPRRPDHYSVWIPGAWDWQGNDWAWLPGRWERPRHGGVTWVRPIYRHEGDAWRYEPGHWSDQRVVEGEEYRRWHSEHGRDHDRDHDHDHDHDHEHR